MKANHALCLVLVLVAVAAGAQGPVVMPLAQEPHHHLALHNDYVNVYRVEVAPGDSVLLHRHEVDAVSVMTDDAMVTVRVADKPDAPQKLSVGQVRLQPKGYVHSTSIDPDSKPYRNVTVELLLPQEGDRNLCAQVIAGLPLNCPPAASSLAGATHTSEPQFETSQTRVTLTRVQPHQSVVLGSPSGSQLAVLLDDAAVSPAAGSDPSKQLHSGDFLWLEAGALPRMLKNSSANEVRFVLFELKPARKKSASAARVPARNVDQPPTVRSSVSLTLPRPYVSVQNRVEVVSRRPEFRDRAARFLRS